MFLNGAYMGHINAYNTYKCFCYVFFFVTYKCSIDKMNVHYNGLGRKCENDTCPNTVSNFFATPNM